MKSKPANKLQPIQSSNSTEIQESHSLSTPARRTPSLKRILVPIDFSDSSAAALDYAVTLAKKFDAKLVLLHVVEPALYPDNYLMTPVTLDEANQNLISTSRERLATMKQESSLQGVAVELLVRMGRAQSEIPDTAKATDTDLIVMGTHGHTGLKHVLLGGTAERVVRHSSCPVLTVRHPGYG